MSRRATRVGTFEVFVPAFGYRKPLPENLAASKPQPGQQGVQWRNMELDH